MTGRFGRNWTRGVLLPVVAVVFALGACQDRAPTATSDSMSFDRSSSKKKIAVSSGNGQTAIVNTAESSPLVVQVTAGGKAVAGVTVQWSATGANGTVSPTSSVSDASGLARTQWTLGPVAGNVSASATVSGTGSVAFTATAVAGSPAKLVLSPDSGNVAVGGSMQFSAAVTDQYGNAVSTTPTWTTLSPQIVSAAAGGLVTGVAGGRGLVVATAGAASDTAAVNVSAAVTPPSPVATHITVAPKTASILVGGATQLTATVYDQNNQVMTFAAVSWSSLNSGIATVSNSGLVTGVAAGTARILASAGAGITDTAVITVSAPAPVTPTPTRLVVSPKTTSVLVGSAVQITATVYDQNGVTMSAPVTWSSLATSVASVSSSGLVTGVAAGTARIVASAGGTAQDTATVTITAPAPTPTRLVVAPKTASVLTGSAVQLTATVYDQNGATMSASVTWSSLATSVASVSSSGLVTGVAAGTARILASAGGTAQDTATVTITAPAPTPTRLVVSPKTGSLLVGGTVQLAATVYDQNGAAMSATVTWSSLATTVASVSSTGLVSGTAAGTAKIVASAGTTAKDTATITVAVASAGGTGESYTGTIATDTWQSYAAQPDATMASLSVASDLYNAKMGFGDGGGGDAIAAKMVQVVTDPSGVFGKVLRYSFPQSATAYNPQGRQATAPLDKVWFKVYLRFKPGWTDAGSLSAANSYKIVFETWETADGRNEIEYSNTGQRMVGYSQSNRTLSTDACYGGDPCTSGAIGDNAVSHEWTDGDWREIIIAFEKTSATTYRVSWWWRKYTVNGVKHGLTWAQTAGNPSLCDQHFAAIVGRLTSGTDISRVAGIAMGVNKNQNTASEEYLYWGPYFAVDGSVNPDPFGVVGLIK